MANRALPSFSSLTDLRTQVAAWRAADQTIALVPTMGALHQGHIELVHLARTKAQRVITSIFVNPTQFAPHEDLDLYPRDLDGDRTMLESAGCDLIWAPDAASMYPDGFATQVVPAGAALNLESEFRPHFFAGVTTVCTKLFNQVAPDTAIFGEKDYQQLCVIRQLVRDLDLAIDIVPVPIVREPDGLALSSRNRYLSATERAIAPALYTNLGHAADKLRKLGADRESIKNETVKAIRTAGFTKIDYVAIRNAETLAIPNRDAPGPCRVLTAAWLGKTRLIDNLAV